VENRMIEAQILVGDCLAVLPTLPEAIVQCCVTSPPYWGLRDYGTAGQLGLEPTPDDYIAKMVAVFREVWRVLKDDGVIWVNMGDSYAGSSMSGGGKESSTLVGTHHEDRNGCRFNGTKRELGTLKHKDLCGIPWRLAFALQADGWYLRSDIIWAKPNPMPESVLDRPTKSHEFIFLLSKRERYFYDAESIKEPIAYSTLNDRRLGTSGTGRPRYDLNGDAACPSGFTGGSMDGRNKRTVWTVPTQPYAEAHFATFPEDLIKPCILAGSKLGDTVLDPFLGSGTTAAVALELGRSAIGIELNPSYAQMARDRCNVTPGFL
jgi:DNA modification methylase